EYDKLYGELKTLDDGPRKQAVIDRMVAVLQQDAPWSFGYFPWGGLAFQQWVHNGKPSILIRDMAKYYRVDPAMRVAKQAEWNKPTYWPIGVILALLLALVWAARRGYQARQRATATPTGVVPLPASEAA
ncbi:MAG: peptide ABC transporter substrate-binding protein, partial [Caldimonas sp.]